MEGASNETSLFEGAEDLESDIYNYNIATRCYHASRRAAKILGISNLAQGSTENPTIAAYPADSHTNISSALYDPCHLVLVPLLHVRDDVR
eukprot:30058-Hanusia_phi.AAC.1